LQFLLIGDGGSVQELHAQAVRIDAILRIIPCFLLFFGVLPGCRSLLGRHGTPIASFRVSVEPS
jgi:hypothetical protein